MNKTNENKMGVKPIPTLVISMSIPLMVSLLVQSLYNIVDGIFVAKISENALTATSIAYPMQMLMVALAVGTSVGLNAYLSKAVGEKNDEKITKSADTGLILSIITALCFMIFGIFGTEFFVKCFSNNLEISKLSTIYLRICLIFCFGTFIQTMEQRFLQAVGDTFYSMVSLIIGAGLNIILDPILIFGLFGIPAMGIKGAAIATVIGQWAGAVSAILLNKYKNPEVKINFKNFTWDKKIVKEIYSVGIPTIITQTMGSLMICAMNIILMPISVTAVAFYGVYYKLQNFIFMPMNGLGQAVIPIIGYNIGARKKERIKDVFKTIIPLSLIIGLIATVIFLIFPKTLLNLFSASEEMLIIGIPALRIISATFMLASLSTVIGYAASGFGNGIINMIVAGIRQFIIYIPITYIMSKILPLNDIWYASWVAEIIAVIYAIVAINKEYKKNNI